MTERFAIAILGSGPAGAAAAILAARSGRRVLLLERGRFPRHKVCGEFISAESLALLARLLGGTPGESLLRSAPRIHRTRLFIDDACVRAAVNPEAASIPRYELDAALWHAAEAAGAVCHWQCAAREVVRRDGGFQLRTDRGEYQAAAVINAAGRWSNLLPAPMARPENWVGVKAHFATARPGDSVDLYFAENGYCGVQPVGDEVVNVCAMIAAGVAHAPARGPAAIRPSDLMQSVLALHPTLQAESAPWTQVTDTVTTAPLMFGTPLPVRDGILCAGDAAGFIDPFLGDGISLALQTGALAAEHAGDPAAYEREYRRHFAPLFRRAAQMRRLITAPAGVRRLATSMMRWPRFSRALVRLTRPPLPQTTASKN